MDDIEKLKQDIVSLQCDIEYLKERVESKISIEVLKDLHEPVNFKNYRRQVMITLISIGILGAVISSVFQIIFRIIWGS